MSTVQVRLSALKIQARFASRPPSVWPPNGDDSRCDPRRDRRGVSDGSQGALGCRFVSAGFRLPSVGRWAAAAVLSAIAASCAGRSVEPKASKCTTDADCVCDPNASTDRAGCVPRSCKETGHCAQDLYQICASEAAHGYLQQPDLHDCVWRGCENSAPCNYLNDRSEDVGIVCESGHECTPDPLPGSDGCVLGATGTDTGTSGPGECVRGD